LYPCLNIKGFFGAQSSPSIEPRKNKISAGFVKHKVMVVTNENPLRGKGLVIGLIRKTA
jgi:hypothetical protein